ncbi:MAG: CoA transferase, partial [Dehalococcoidia bacterium]
MTSECKSRLDSPPGRGVQTLTGPLSDIRVLDLTGEAGLFAGRQLAELGADVIRIEPPGGDASRHRSPFLQDRPGLERSLYHLHFNAGKRGIVLDLEKAAGASKLRRLARTADVLVETFAPGRLDALGLGYEALAAENPSLIYTTITPFGQHGPQRGYRGNDLIGAAASGLMYLNGFEVDAPNVPGAEQAYHMASVAAVAGSLTALARRDRGRRGGRVDVSLQEAASMATVQTANANYYTWHGKIIRRRKLPPEGRGPYGIYLCSDRLWLNFTVPIGAP